jgi:hypothetical protein
VGRGALCFFRRDRRDHFRRDAARLNYEEERAKARAEKLKTAEEEWNKTSSSYGWVDKEKGVARIPIERAMELELADLQAKKPRPPVRSRLRHLPRRQSSDWRAATGNPPNPRPRSPIRRRAVEGPKSEVRAVQPAAAVNPPTRPGIGTPNARRPPAQNAFRGPAPGTSNPQCRLTEVNRKR